MNFRLEVDGFRFSFVKQFLDRLTLVLSSFQIVFYLVSASLISLNCGLEGPS